MGELAYPWTTLQFNLRKAESTSCFGRSCTIKFVDGTRFDRVVADFHGRLKASRLRVQAVSREEDRFEGSYVGSVDGEVRRVTLRVVGGTRGVTVSLRMS